MAKKTSNPRKAAVQAQPHFLLPLIDAERAKIETAMQQRNAKVIRAFMTRPDVNDKLGKLWVRVVRKYKVPPFESDEARDAWIEANATRVLGVLISYMPQVDAL